MTKAGVLIIDKPQGLTSHDVVGRVRRVSGIRRVGHAGTLDPLATGVLVVCVGWATRFIEYVVGQPKSYEATVRLGQTTDSFDADGMITAERPVDVDAGEIEAALADFRGEIRQQAPVYSAIKQDGQPLHKRARRGEVVEAPVRDVTIYALTLVAYEPPDLELRIVCSTGTYVRSLAHDLGRTLGCGGHIVALRRTAVGEFTVRDAVPLDVLTSENWTTYLQPPDAAVAHLPAIQLEAEDAVDLRHGRPVTATSGAPDGTLLRVYNDAGHMLGVAESVSGLLRVRKNVPDDAYSDDTGL